MYFSGIVHRKEAVSACNAGQARCSNAGMAAAPAELKLYCKAGCSHGAGSVLSNLRWSTSINSMPQAITNATVNKMALP